MTRPRPVTASFRVAFPVDAIYGLHNLPGIPAGELHTRNGTLLFVIFNQRGSVARFRSFQNNYVSLIQGQFGGPVSIPYTPVALDARLARTRIQFANTQSAGN